MFSEKAEGNGKGVSTWRMKTGEWVRSFTLFQPTLWYIIRWKGTIEINWLFIHVPIDLIYSRTLLNVKCSQMLNPRLLHERLEIYIASCELILQNHELTIVWTFGICICVLLNQQSSLINMFLYCYATQQHTFTRTFQLQHQRLLE